MFTLPAEGITTASVTDLNALERTALAEFDTLSALDPEALTDDQVTQMETLVDGVTQIRAERDGRATAAAARLERAAAARVAMSTVTPEPDADPDADEPQPDDDDDAGDDSGDDGDEGTVQPDGSTVTAAAGRRKRANTSVVRSARKTPQVRPQNGALTLVAAADLPGIATGSHYEDLAGIAKGFAKRFSAFPKGKAPRNDMFQRYGVAALEKDFGDLSDKSPQFVNNPLDLIDAAAKEARLPGGSLVAAGGWCAPSETLYDLCESESLDGLIDLPEIGISRGGIRFTRGPDFSDIFQDAGFIFTEAEIEGGVEKPCFEVDCPDFEEVRLDAMGICVRAPLLTNVGYPELIQRYVRGVLVAHQHKISSYLIQKMVDVAGTGTDVAGIAGTGMDLLGALEWVGESLRYRYRLSFNETLEVVLPHWLLPIIRQDLALRQGRDSANAVTNQQINALFGERGVRVQWVYNWQDLVTQQTTPPTTPAPNQCLAVIPETVQVLAYPAGTFVRGTADVISLDAVYDTASLKENMYTALFAEEGNLVANRCFDACLIEVPVCMAGLVGGNLPADTCWSPIAAPAGP